MAEARGRGLTIAVDGPGSAGKGTVAKGVARALGYQYIDTGAMYRAVALFAHRSGVDWDDEPGLARLIEGLDFSFEWDGDVLRVLVNREDITSRIRTEEIGAGASRVSRLSSVRAGLLQLQQRLGAAGGVVMDGRDIGTVVLPGAELKIYLDASLDERARRRHEEMLRRGETVRFDAVRSSLGARDAQDMGRAIAPLKQADDAKYLDTTNSTIANVIEQVLKMAQTTLDDSL
jgi:cytidylate kinase